MSKAQLDKFISAVSSDPSVLEQATKGEEDLQKCARNVVQYAKAQGYEFTEDEAREWLAERAGELKDSQLDAVAGGAAYVKMPKPETTVAGPTPHMTPMGAAPTLGSYDLKLGAKVEGKH